MTLEDVEVSDPKPSDERNGCFLDSMWCCEVCDGEIPDGHTDDCYIWKLEKKHQDFIANEYNKVLTERAALQARLEAAERSITELLGPIHGAQDQRRLRDEAGLCRNETATDVARLLDEAADALDDTQSGEKT